MIDVNRPVMRLEAPAMHCYDPVFVVNDELARIKPDLHPLPHECIRHRVMVPGNRDRGVLVHTALRPDTALKPRHGRQQMPLLLFKAFCGHLAVGYRLSVQSDTYIE